ncbi:MAG: carbohydrate ABC transporter permease [Chloroflexota bacterium]|nr:carbohydrate ABC transporter permease [Chloroflexota bacterium]
MATHKTRWGIHIGLIVVCFVLAIPALYALQLATLTLEGALATPPQLFPPGDDLLANFSDLFTRENFGALMLNTTIVALVVTIGKTILALLAGLAFVYFRFPGKAVLFFAVLFTLLLPTEIILLPLFRMMGELGWGENYPMLALTLPFLATAAGMFLFRQHFQNIPRELAEAAQIDGATPLRFLVDVLVPMSWNVIGAHALVQFIAAWNQYLWPRLVVTDAAQQMIQVGVRGTISAGLQTDFGLLMAAGIMASLPPLILFVALHKQFMNGFALTTDK